MIDPYESLVQAIVLQAVKDYKRALKKKSNSIIAGKEKAECEKFLLSDWFNELTGLDGRLILEKLQEEG